MSSAPAPPPRALNIACVSRITLAHGVHGGMERHLDDLARGLVARGHRVDVFTTAHPDRLPHLLQDGVHYHFLASPSGRYRRAWWQASTRAVAARAADYDVIWGEGSAAEPVARLRRRPPLVSVVQGTYHGEMRTRLRQWRSPRMWALAALMAWRRATWRAHIERAARVIAVSPGVADDVLATTALPPDRLAIIPNGVDIGRFRPDPAARAATRRRLAIDDDAVVAVAVSRLEREKGVDLAIRAAAAVTTPPLHLLIAGHGTTGAQLEALARRAAPDGRIRLVGFVVHDALPALLSAADLFVQPTLRDEGLPISALEAMATGLPVVASDISGLRAAVASGREGVLVPLGDTAALAQALQRLAADGAARATLAAAARARAVAEFSVEQMVVATEAVLMQAATGAGAR